MFSRRSKTARRRPGGCGQGCRSDHDRYHLPCDLRCLAALSKQARQAIPGRSDSRQQWLDRCNHPRSGEGPHQSRLHPAGRKYRLAPLAEHRQRTISSGGAVWQPAGDGGNRHNERPQTGADHRLFPLESILHGKVLFSSSSENTAFSIRSPTVATIRSPWFRSLAPGLGSVSCRNGR